MGMIGLGHSMGHLGWGQACVVTKPSNLNFRMTDFEHIRAAMILMMHHLKS